MQNSHINSKFFNRKWTNRGIRVLQFVHILDYKACFFFKSNTKNSYEAKTKLLQNK